MIKGIGVSFFKKCPTNDKKEDKTLKIRTLNSIYSLLFTEKREKIQALTVSVKSTTAL